MGSYTSKDFFTVDDIDEMLNMNMNIVIYKNRIYDITHLLDFDHPGGLHLLENNIGNDITEHMQFHSKKAKKMLKKYFIGYLK